MSVLARNRCYYKDCKNKRGDEGVVLFCYPDRKKKKEKFDLWCQNSGINEDEIRNRMQICNAHFISKHFTTYERQKLLYSAVPMHYTDYYQQLDHNNQPEFNPEKLVRVYGSNKVAEFEEDANENSSDEDSPQPKNDSDRLAETSGTSELYIPSPPHVQSYHDTDDHYSQEEVSPLESNPREVQLEAENQRLREKVRKVEEENQRLRSMLSKVNQQLLDLKSTIVMPTDSSGQIRVVKRCKIEPKKSISSFNPSKRSKN